MKIRVFIISIVVSVFFCGMVNGEEPVRILPELAEWGGIGAVFITAKWLDDQPAWNIVKISKNSIDLPFHENTVSTGALYAAVGVTAMGIGLIPNNDGWMKMSSYRHTKGFIEALSATYLSTNVIKNAVGRKRPSFSNYTEEEEVDANKSFPSGHTAISFASATYSSLYVIDYFGNSQKRYLPWIYITGSHLLAAYVGYTRVTDNRHFPSDVVIGGILGSGSAWLIYKFTESRNNLQSRYTNVSLAVSPGSLLLTIPF